MKQQVARIGLAFIFVMSMTLTVVAQSEEAQQRRANAEELRQQREEARAEAREAISAEREERIQDRCSAALARVQTVLENAQAYRENQAEVYNSWRIKLDTFLSRVGSSGLEVDLNDITNSLATLDGLADELSASFSDYISEITTLGDTDCQTNPQAFQDSLLVARDLRKAVVSARQSLKDFIQTDIKADLQAIRDAVTSSEEG